MTHQQRTQGSRRRHEAIVSKRKHNREKLERFLAEYEKSREWLNSLLDEPNFTITVDDGPDEPRWWQFWK